MRVCPKCGDYYADSSLAFCLADGTPLAGVDPASPNWSEGSRVIAEKANALSKQKRRLKWRRVSLVTMMILTVAAFMLAAARNRFYLEPPAPPPATPTPTPDESPTPALTTYKINGRVLGQNKPLGNVRIMLSGAEPGSTTTDVNGNYAFSDLPAGGSYAITPQPSGTMSFQPSNQTINKLTKDESADFVLVQPDVYKISGRVTDANQPLSEVNLTLFDGVKRLKMMTDRDGKYAFSNLPAGAAYTITPTRDQMVFNPLRYSIDKLTKDESANFDRAKPVVYKISGQVTEVIPGRPAAGLPGVLISLKGEAKTLFEKTDEKGRYTFSGVPAGGTYTVSVDIKEFSSASHRFDHLAEDEKADFVLDKKQPTPTPTPNECSDANKEAERKIIIPKVSASLRQQFIAAQGPKGPWNVDEILRKIKYEVVFSKTCQNAVVTPSLQIPGLAIPKLRDFKCRKTRDEWSCY